MKSLVRTITVFAILIFTVSGLALAQAASTPPEPTPAPETAEPSQVGTVETAAEEVQMEAAREQMEAARAQMDAAREQMERAKSTGEKSLSKLSKNLAELRFNFTNPFSRSDASAVLVIPTSEMKAEDIVTIIEDMTVMARIIDKQLGQEQSRQMWFSRGFMGHSSRMAETMYLQGYGALFLKKVDFPLSPGPEAQEEEQQTKKEEGTDPVWEQTKKDFFEPQEDRKRREERPEEKYDAEKVENLKTNVVKALKHAANIRNLKSDESVILTVTGGGSSGGFHGYGLMFPGRGQVLVQNKGNKSLGIVAPTPPTLPTLPNSSGFSSPTVLIIRAKKSDIDSFAKGDLDFDKFRERVLIFTQ